MNFGEKLAVTSWFKGWVALSYEIKEDKPRAAQAAASMES